MSHPHHRDQFLMHHYTLWSKSTPISRGASSSRSCWFDAKKIPWSSRTNPVTWLPVHGWLRRWRTWRGSMRPVIYKLDNYWPQWRRFHRPPFSQGCRLLSTNHLPLYRCRRRLHQLCSERSQDLLTHCRRHRQWMIPVSWRLRRDALPWMSAMKTPLRLASGTEDRLPARRRPWLSAWGKRCSASSIERDSSLVPWTLTINAASRQHVLLQRRRDG